MNRRSVVVAVVIVLVIVVIVGMAAVKRYENYLSGMWVGDPSFLERAQLKDMQLFLAPRKGGKRQGYLIMTDLAGGFVANQAFELAERSAAQRWWTALRSAFRTRRDAYSARRVTVAFDEPGAEPPMPERMSLTLSILEGTLTLHGDGQIYAFLEKDLVASASALEAYEA